MPSTIAIDELRVGMYIHIDDGWLSHPFPFSSFRIGSADQIATLRGLGLRHLRWSPEHSAPGPADPAAAPVAEPSAATGSDPGAAAAPTRAGADAGAAARRIHREALRTQRDSQLQCELQFIEASRAWRQAMDAVGARPDLARCAAHTLAGALTDKLMASGEIGIRLLAGGGTDRAATHALNVSVIAMLVGRTLGLACDDMYELSLGALMHDVGKLKLPERVHHVEPDCIAAELHAYREHVGLGLAAGRRMHLAAGVLGVIAQHHEHSDGSGFPERLGGDRITLAARIVALANRYDNLCNATGRARPLTPHEAVATLFAHGRGHYDGAVLNAFVRTVGIYPAGSLVQLTDDRYGIVTGVNASRPLRPRVLVHEAGVPREEALLLDLQGTPDVGIRRSLCADKLPVAALDYLDPRPRVSYFFEPLDPARAAPVQAA